jgi:hypothetical protein
MVGPTGELFQRAPEGLFVARNTKGSQGFAWVPTTSSIVYRAGSQVIVVE